MLLKTQDVSGPGLYMARNLTMFSRQSLLCESF